MRYHKFKRFSKDRTILSETEFTMNLNKFYSKLFDFQTHLKCISPIIIEISPSDNCFLETPTPIFTIKSPKTELATIINNYERSVVSLLQVFHSPFSYQNLLNAQFNAKSNKTFSHRPPLSKSRIGPFHLGILNVKIK